MLCFVRKTVILPLLYIKSQILCHILVIAGTATIPAPETSSSVIAGAVTGGSIAGIIAMLVPIIACLIYYRRRKMKSSALHMRYILNFKNVFFTVPNDFKTFFAILLTCRAIKPLSTHHTYAGDANVEMQQFDKHRYYFPNLFQFIRDRTMTQTIYFLQLYTPLLSAII